MSKIFQTFFEVLKCDIPSVSNFKKRYGSLLSLNKPRKGDKVSPNFAKRIGGFSSEELE